MSNALALNNNLSIWDDEQKIAEIRKIFAPTLTALEFEYFVSLGKAAGLNPFMKELWAVKYGTSAAQIFIGRDGYRIAAQRHAKYDYHQADAVYENDQFKIHQGEVSHSYSLRDRGKLVGAYCIVKRKGSERPMYVYVELSEYSTGKSLWHPQTGKPATMIKKVAEAQALRACFQDLLGGTYLEDEMPAQEPKLNVVSGSTQTERLKQVLNMDSETGEVIENDKPTIHNTGRDDIAINDEQMDEISSIFVQLQFSQERIARALDYYKVDSLEQLTDAQARLLLLQLGKL